MSRPITIHSDGTGRGTVILDEDGKQLEGVTHLSVSIAANGVAEATIEVMRSNMTLKADLVEVIYTCPSCNEMMEHTCDPTMGNLNQSTSCDSKLIMRDPYLETQCIRGHGHPDNHFDGIRVWE